MSVVDLSADVVPRLDAHDGELGVLTREHDRTERVVAERLLLDVADPRIHRFLLLLGGDVLVEPADHAPIGGRRRAAVVP